LTARPTAHQRLTTKSAFPRRQEHIS
jgi:hypothetical protein